MTRAFRGCVSIVAAIVLAASCGGSTKDSTSSEVGTAGNGAAGNGGSGNRAGSGNASGTGGSGNVSGGGATGGSATGGSATDGSGNASGNAGAGNISGTGAVDASNDGPPPADAPFACGSTTCEPTQFCIHPCCGGPQPLCMPVPDGGTCPSGWHSGCSSFGQCSNPSACCEMDPCAPPPPYCSAATFGGCLAEGRDCYLLCA